MRIELKVHDVHITKTKTTKVLVVDQEILTPSVASPSVDTPEVQY